jgi:hypothetical protein
MLNYDVEQLHSVMSVVDHEQRLAAVEVRGQ